MTAALKIIIAAGAVALIWQGWENLSLLRGTWLNDLRLVLLLVAAFVVLSAAQWLSARVDAMLGGPAEHPPG